MSADLITICEKCGNGFRQGGINRSGLMVCGFCLEKENIEIETLKNRGNIAALKAENDKLKPCEVCEIEAAGDPHSFAEKDGRIIEYPRKYCTACGRKLR